MPEFVLPARPGSCRGSQDLAHGIQGGFERYVRQTKPFCISKVRAVCSDHLPLCPGNTAQTLIFLQKKNKNQKTPNRSLVGSDFCLEFFPI